MSLQTIPSARSNSYAFRSWLERTTFRGKNKEFVDRLKKDALAPHSIGPRTPNALLSYVIRQLEKPSSRAVYDAGDIPIIWNLWVLFQGEEYDRD